MTNRYVEQAKSILLAELRKAPAGTSEIDIPCEGPENARLFREALELVEVRREFNRRHVRANIREINPSVQVKQYMLDTIRSNNLRDREIGFQCQPKDSDLYYQALGDPEVQSEVIARSLKAEVVVLGRPRDAKIVIATYDDVASGKLDEYFGR